MSATSDSIRIAFFEKFWEAFYNDNQEATGNLKPLWDEIVGPHLSVNAEKAKTDMRKLIQLTSTAVAGMDGSTTTFVYGLCDDGTAWELYAGDGVGWSPLPAIPQNDAAAT